MAFSVSTQGHFEDGFEIYEYTVHTEGAGEEHDIFFTNADHETDAFAIVEAVTGEVTVLADGFEPDDRLTTKRTYGFSYDAESNFRSIGLRLQFSTGATVSVLVARIRRGFRSAVGNAKCKLCKSAVMALIRAALAFAGIPLPLSGFDLSSAQASFEAAVDALKQGQMNKALASLAALLPSSVWDAIKQAMHVINWIWDSVDKRIEWVCIRIGMCPAPSPNTP